MSNHFPRRVVTFCWLLLAGCHHQGGAETALPPPGTATPSPTPAAPAPATPAPANPAPVPVDASAPVVAPTPSVADSAVAPPTVAADAAVPTPTPAAAALVAGLTLQRFRADIAAVAALGDRLQGSPSYDTALAWLQKQLEGMGYAVEHHAFTYQGSPRINTLATKVGTRSPDRMYIVSAHLDGRGGGGGADDNGSGVALVLQLARALAAPGVQTDVSVRFAFWCNEETGMDGSRAYVAERAARQGMEAPPGSGKFPEPRWLGMIQHDMLLYDHGLPPGPMQSPTADVNIDYQVSSKQAAASKQLAEMVAAAARVHGPDWPSTVGSNMEGTDSVAFEDFAPSISVREARRVEEILRGSNPNHHKPSDQPESYSDADYRFGFNIVKLSMGAVAALAGAHLAN
jgi:Zn-dependent M28 family amino/carboxypeptidase